MDYGILQGHLKTIWQLSSLPEVGHIWGWEDSYGGKAVNVFTVLFISS